MRRPAFAAFCSLLLVLSMFPLKAQAYNQNDLNLVLMEADCSGCDLSNANLTGVTLMTEAPNGSLRGMDLTNANLSGAILVQANMSQAILTGTNLTNANLSGAYLNQVHAESANFTGANLTGANLSGPSTFVNCSFTGAVMGQTSRVQILLPASPGSTCPVQIFPMRTSSGTISATPISPERPSTGPISPEQI